MRIPHDVLDTKDRVIEHVSGEIRNLFLNGLLVMAAFTLAGRRKPVRHQAHMT